MQKEFMNLLFMVKTLVLALYGGMPLEERQAEEICKELDKIEDRMNELSGGGNVDASDSNFTIHGVIFSLRDKLASEAFATLFKEQHKLNPRGYTFGSLGLDTKRSYQIADAMIKARSNES